MKVLSCNTGEIKTYEFEGVTLNTSMVRTPQSKITVKFNQVLGDTFANPKNHGTLDAVVYALASSHYEDLNQSLKASLAWGCLGENLTLSSLNEDDFKIDDEWSVGTTRLRVTGPRYPCNKLNFVTENKYMREIFLNYGKPGVYFQVLQEGEIKLGDTVKLETRIQSELSVLDVYLANRAAEKKEPRGLSVDRVLNYPTLLDKYRKRVQLFYQNSDS